MENDGTCGTHVVAFSDITISTDSTRLGLPSGPTAETTENTPFPVRLLYQFP